MQIVAQNMLGVDISKEWIDLCDGDQATHIDNSIKGVSEFIKTLEVPTLIAVEPTNRYHRLFVECALSKGHTVYLVDAYRVSRYRDAVGVRAKTDPADAQLLYRYLSSEINHLSPYCPPPKAVQHLNDLLRVRGKLVQEKLCLRQSLSGVEEIAEQSNDILASIDRAILKIDEKLEQCLEQAGYTHDYQRCQAISGVGPVIGAALVAMYHRGVFRKADAFIAFMGLDVRVRESGKFRGQRKITKRGNPEIRRLLFNGARAGARTKQWNAYYTSLRERGLPTTAAHIAIARKIARLAFALMRDQTEYRAIAI